MSADGVGEVVERAMSDPAFRRRLAEDPAAALAGYELTPEERAAFTSGSARAERLEERISKTDLSASIAAKTASPLLHAPSESRKKR